MSDNPPAFPADQHGDSYHIGMSLRDYFAGQALAAVAASRQDHESWTWNMADVASDSYAMADAMLAEREKAS